MKKSPATDGAVALAFEQRASRAAFLAPTSESAREPLEFAARLYRAQAALARWVASRALSGVLGRDLDAFIEETRGVLEVVATTPESPRALRSRLESFWTDGGRDLLARALLRPYVETLAAADMAPDRPRPAGACPFCGGAPWIAARRAAAESDGAQRYLGCALCGGEWIANRIRCPACAEEDPARLPSFTGDRYPAVRIEACESCHCYTKSIDLTVDARVIPEVDDLASLAMDLWAGEAGFSRIEPGLAGI